MNMVMAPVYRQPMVGDWPEADLEYLGKCPVCGSEARRVAYSGLKDRVFFSAPGTWTSWRCEDCDVAYLDPRPNMETISRAYETYYTHAAEPEAAPATVFSRIIKKLRQLTKNSFFNKRFHYYFKSYLPFGWFAFSLQPERAFHTACFMRHLPGPTDATSRLLDVGCGAGLFLKFARDELGFRVEGLEIDPASRRIAEGRGLTIHAGSMPGSGLAQAQYDQVTLSHVVEHFHDPKAALGEVFLLLKPGGRIWIQVPNIAAISLQRFGITSLLLDAPRHLVMFDSGSLTALLKSLGFENLQLLDLGKIGGSVFFQQSWMVEKGMDPFNTPPSVVPKAVKAAQAAMYNQPAWSPKTADIVTIIANRPASDGC